MLTKLQLEHFKCFDRLYLPLASLTLLSGLNAAGKSSILQALSLLHQTTQESEWNTTLILNGTSVALGSAGDVIDQISGRNTFRIGLASENYECVWTMQTEHRAELSIPITTIIWRETPEWIAQNVEIDDTQQRIYQLLPETILNHSTQAKQLSTTLTRLTYISADRIGPRETYIATTADQQTNVGPRGEFTPWFLYHFAEQKPLDGLLIEETPPTLQRQTEAWMQQFFPGSNFVVEPVKGANLMTMGIRTSNATDYHRPQNVGYGLTHVLPILTACLGAQQGDLILIENPESHLHPAGQSQMGKFLARTAMAGAQIVIETHSDHILNGVRRSVKEGLLSPDEVALHFFLPRDEDKAKAQVVTPLIDASGTIDRWPEGFFDQLDKDTSALIDW